MNQETTEAKVDSTVAEQESLSDLQTMRYNLLHMARLIVAQDVAHKNMYEIRSYDVESGNHVMEPAAHARPGVPKVFNITADAVLAEARKMEDYVYGKPQRTLIHLRVGSDTWEPTKEELNELIATFQHAEFDPLGALVVTAKGVDAHIRGSQTCHGLTIVTAEVVEREMKAEGRDAFSVSGGSQLFDAAHGERKDTASPAFAMPYGGKLDVNATGDVTMKADSIEVQGTIAPAPALGGGGESLRRNEDGGLPG